MGICLHTYINILGAYNEILATTGHREKAAYPEQAQDLGTYVQLPERNHQEESLEDDVKNAQ